MFVKKNKFFLNEELEEFHLNFVDGKMNKMKNEDKTKE